MKNPFKKLLEPKQALMNAVEETKQFELYAKTLECPACKKTQGFDVVSYERGKQGWEATLYCRHCATQAVLNESGFQFTGMEMLLTH